MAMGLFQSIDWLTKKVKKLCCWLGIIEEYTGANLPYVEIYYTDYPGNPSIADYNTQIFEKVGGGDADFSSVVTVPLAINTVERIYGSSGNLKLRNGVFNAGSFGGFSIAQLNDPFGLIKEIGSTSLKSNPLQQVYLPNVSVIGDGAFGTTILTTIYIPKCTQLGSTVGDDLVFDGIIGFNITLKVDPSRLTCNAGGPDGDIVNLQIDNTVVIN